jgi:hypothetical protein
MEPNAFAAEFLERFDQNDDPVTSLEAATCGPWRVIRLDNARWGVLQDGDATPQAVFMDRNLALLAAAMLPASGRNDRFILVDEAATMGFPVRELGRRSKLVTVGWLATFEEEVVDALQSGVHLALSPGSLALLLEATGPAALRRAGAILVERLRTGMEERNAQR